MAVRVDIEEIETTKSEKLLAVVLAVFLAVGGIWAYQRIDDAVRSSVAIPEATPAEQAAFDAASATREQVLAAEQDEEAALETLTLARERYRTALDAERRAPELERAYEAAEAGYRAAQERLTEARIRAAAAEEAAVPLQREIARRRGAAQRDRALLTIGLRLALVLGSLGAAYLAVGRLRHRGSRWLPVAFAAVGAAALLALVLAGDYVTDYVDPLELGPLVLAATGAVLTVAAFAALQRYLARRLPFRRVRKGECPFCGFPAGSGDHCEGCGRDLVASCARCEQSRRVGTLHCRACGQP